MAETTSLRMQTAYDRMRLGDTTAREEFDRLAYGRLMALAREIKRDFPGPEILFDTEDVLSDAYLR